MREANEFTLSILDYTRKGLINTVPNSFILVYFGWYMYCDLSESKIEDLYIHAALCNN